MRVLKLTLGKIFFSAIFPSASIFQCEASGRSLLASGRVQLKWTDCQATHRSLSHAYVQHGSRRVSEPFGRGPHKL
jgi:hypothetical protein